MVGLHFAWKHVFHLNGNRSKYNIFEKYCICCSWFAFCLKNTFFILMETDSKYNILGKYCICCGWFSFCLKKHVFHLNGNRPKIHIFEKYCICCGWFSFCLRKMASILLQNELCIQLHTFSPLWKRTLNKILPRKYCICYGFHVAWKHQLQLPLHRILLNGNQPRIQYVPKSYCICPGWFLIWNKLGLALFSHHLLQPAGCWTVCSCCRR